ncbi:hypothetical protein [Alteromonas stellipolaris]|uniref:hypothetical protein n=1 Tax=Alteromonas stellipolaris TaxID=233316 RepID=UPI002494AF0D|nr:hypothetical protein [Alteromonas stellipolaris]
MVLSSLTRREPIHGGSASASMRWKVREPNTASLRSHFIAMLGELKNSADDKP